VAVPVAYSLFDDVSLFVGRVGRWLRRTPVEEELPPLPRPPEPGE
jgi:hypothetical protein